MNLYELTNPQKSIWLTEQFYKGTAVNNICGTVLIDEEIVFDKLIDAINIFIRDNDSFRIHIVLDKDGNAKQYFGDYSPSEFTVVTLQDQNELSNLEHEMANIPFDIFDNNLYNFQLFKFKDNKGGFVLNTHHLIADACTAGIIASKIVNIYSSLIKNEPITEIPTSYINYINSENEYLNSNKFIKDKEYWEENFKSSFDLASLSTYNLDTSSHCNCDANRKVFVLKKRQVKAIENYCKKNNFSLFNFFMAIYALYIGKVRNLKHFVLGTPILNRTTFGEKHTPGMFISTVPFYFNLEGNPTFKDFITSITVQTIGMFRHQKYPYQEILSYLRKQDSSIPNLYNIMISYQNTKTEKDASDIKYDVRWTHSDFTSDELDIHLFDMNNYGTLNIAYDYQTAKYSLDDITNIHNRILYIIKQVLEASSSLALNKINLVTPEEKYTILHKYNHDRYQRIDKTVIDLFLEQVKNVPDKTAISDNGKSLTFSQLDAVTDSFCAYFAENGLKPKDKICLFLNNSIELVISIISILKYGACYIPIDVTYPTDRIEYIAQNSGCKRIITNQDNVHKLNFLSNISMIIDYEKLVNLSTSPTCYNHSKLHNLAYIIYTSGSTGNPKGVKIAHESLSNYISWANTVYVQNEECNFPLYSSIAFDLTVTSIFTPLISGNTIYIYNNSNPELCLKQMIDDKKVQIIKLTPAHLTLLLDCLTSDTIVTKLIVGGDILTKELCKKITKKVKNVHIYNEYGPTEATVGCMIHEYSPKDDNYASVPIGIPAKNVNLYVLNDDLNLIPCEQRGELYISGKCLSKGYVKLKAINNERFLPSPFKKSSKLYKTGDIVTLHSNQVMEYIGRTDFQVKINGFRIEMGEIQSRILKYPNIKDCYVTTIQKDSNKVLCAYYVCDKERPVILKYLKEYLVKFLPTYMLPKYFVSLDGLPLTSNGKIQKDKLPIPTNSEHDVFVEPEGDLEVLLAKIFCKLLNIKKMSATGNFFDYYVDSLIIIKAQTLLYNNGININTQAFYEYPSIRSLAKFIESKKEVTDIESSAEELATISEIKHKNKRTKISYKNILLFGATGFLGIHILHSILQNSSAHIYCIIREKDNLNSIQRFYNKFEFYFGREELEKYKDRITTITGNILKEKFGLSTDSYDELGSLVDCVINSAAIVKHYGNYSDFYNTNVFATKQMVDFCIKYHAHFHYISTMSVSGYGLVECPDRTFTENDFYVGQKYKDNVYVNSKFEAENVVLSACKNNKLKASIYRIGNITNRFSDGIFQQNAGDNAFLNRITSIINLGNIPKEVMHHSLEFTPVDFCADFIVKLLSLQENNINVYHLYNDKYVSLHKLLTILQKYDINIKIVPMEKFEKEILSAPDKYFGITNYLTNVRNKDFNKIHLSNEYTNSLLKKQNLEWPVLSEEYISKIIDYLIKNKSKIF